MAAGAVSRTLEELESRGGLRGTDIANVTDTSKATVSRWRTGTIRPQPKNELILADLAYVVNRLSEFYTNDEIRAWLYARHPQLAGERALDLIHARRAEEVLNVINRLDSEIYL